MLKEIIKMTQPELFQTLIKNYQDNCIYKKGSFILVQGNAPVMLVAHLDTVHKEPVSHICTTEDGNILMSPQGIGGDDRCGVYALVSVYAKANKRPWLLFTCDEEIGCVGAGTFCELYEKQQLPDLGFLKYIVEIDRKGSSDAVYYDCENADFEEYITSKGYKTAIGSFSDISYVAPTIGVAAVNLSSGYYNAHTQHEFINLSQLERTIEKVTEMVNESASETVPQFEYMEVSFGGDYLYQREFFDGEPYDYLSREGQEMYNELLAFYTKGELDEEIFYFGEESIWDMYSEMFEALEMEV